MISRRSAIAGFGCVAVGAVVARTPNSSGAESTWRSIRNGERFIINSVDYEAECGATETAIQQSQNGVLRFQMIPGNNWPKEAANDAERTEIDGWKSYVRPGKPLWVSWSMYLEEGARSTADWCILQQIYQVGGSPAVHILKPDGNLHWAAQAVGEGADSLGKHVMPIEYGRWYNFVETYKFDPHGGRGYWKSWVNGEQVLDYQGPLGTIGAKAYFPKFGIYRAKYQSYNGTEAGSSNVEETMSVRFCNCRFGTEDLSKLVNHPERIPGYERWPGKGKSR